MTSTGVVLIEPAGVWRNRAVSLPKVLKHCGATAGRAGAGPTAATCDGLSRTRRECGEASGAKPHDETDPPPNATEVAPLSPLPKIVTWVAPLAVPWLGPTALTTGSV